MEATIVDPAMERRERASADIGGEIDRRLDELKAIALDEGIAVCGRSEHDARGFQAQLGLAKRPALFLTDGGNCSAVWEDDAGNRVGLEFEGDGVVEYACLKRLDSGRIETSVGRGALASLCDHIATAGLDGLLAA